MEKRLTADLNVVANSNLEIQLLDGDLNIIQKLDDEPNDVGGLTSAELKAKFDEGGNIIKKYINETLIPSVLTDDATEESRKQAEAARVAAEQGRVTAEEGRVSAESGRVSAEQARDSAETVRSGAESTRQSQEAARQTAETKRNSAETARVQSEQGRSTAETARTNAETARREAETSRATGESNRAVAEQGRVSGESTRVQNETQRVSAEQARSKAESSRVSAENAREAAEKARADETAGIVASATAQANAAARSAESASASAQTAQSASSSAGTAASTASSAAAAASGSASQAQASAAAAAQSAASVDGINKTAQSWAVGGTGTRPGEDTDNAKYWAEQAQAVVGGDFATKVEAQGYVTTHNQSVDAHADIRKALNGKEASGTAATAVSTHNKDTSAHADIRNALNGKEAFGTAAAAVAAHNTDATAHADIREALDGKEAAGAAAAVQENLDTHTGNANIHVTADDKANWNSKVSKPKACLVTLKSSGWDAGAKTQTVTVGGILADEATQRVLALPAVASAAAYRDDGICMTARENGTVTFSAKTVPSANLKVWVSWESVEDVTPPSASVAPQSGVLYTAGLSGLEASDVTAFAQAISNCSDVTNETTVVYVDFGSIHREISVGDQVTLPLNGTNYAFDVIGFNHDELTAPTAYGVATATGKAGITFQMHDLFGTYFAMNDSTTNVGGWKSSKMRTSTMVTMKGYLPAAWQTVIKPVNKASGTGGEFSRGTETVSDGCFLLAEVEIFGNTTYSVVGEGVQYAYYKAGNSKIKNRNGSADYWWERSPGFGDNISFCYVNEVGNVANIGANRTNCVAFGFCV